MTTSGYNGNPNLPKANTQHNWTAEMINEYIKCKADPVYFAETYFKIVHVDKGLIPFKLYEYQKEAIRLSSLNRKFVMNASRQCGKCISLNTSVKLRNKKSGEVMDISIADFMRLRLREDYGRFDETTEEELIRSYIATFGKPG